MKLVIFDLDQTLVDLISIHNEVTQALFLKEFGVKVRLTDIDFAGKSLNDVFKELAASKDIIGPDYERKRVGLLQKYDELFARRIPEDGSKFVLPGARELIKELSRLGHFVVLYTGGSRSIGENVLRITGLRRYFRLMFYGTEFKARADMVSIAIEQADIATGLSFRGKDVVIVGDPIRDIECGKIFHALTISIATGFHSSSQLKANGPDYLFPNLKQWKKIAGLINS
jgi:phosphoglycolate phosphatase-like HAD superfamily hydrolase